MPSEADSLIKGQTCKYIIMYLHVISMLCVHHMSNVPSVKIHSDTELHGRIKESTFLGENPKEMIELVLET